MKTNKAGFIPFLALFLIGFSAITVATLATAQTSIPTSPLYGIKLATEKARLALAYNDEAKARTHLSIAEARLEEMKVLEDENVPPNDIQNVEKNFDEHQASAEAYIHTDDFNQRSLELSKNLNRNEKANEEIWNKINTKNSLVNSTSSQPIISPSSHSSSTPWVKPSPTSSPKGKSLQQR